MLNRSYTPITTNFFKTKRGIHHINGVSSVCIVNFYFMLQTCKFQEGADIVQTVPSLGVDIHSAIETGIIQDTSASVFHNEMKELGEIGMVVRDPFDIIEYERSYGKFRQYVKDNEDKKKKSE